MNGWLTEMVDSSWIEALGGLSRCEMRNVPPAFWAKAGRAATTQAADDAARIAKRKRIFIFLPDDERERGTLFVLVAVALADHLQCARVKPTRVASTVLSARFDCLRDRESTPTGRCLPHRNARPFRPP